jgi:hypothetical protein
MNDSAPQFVRGREHSRRQEGGGSVILVGALNGTDWRTANGHWAGATGLASRYGKNHKEKLAATLLRDRKPMFMS